MIAAQGPFLAEEWEARDHKMLRGLSLDERQCVVGDSLFSTRVLRRYVPGKVHFFDRLSWHLNASLEVPAAPTEIRRIDGNDLSLTNYVRLIAGLSDANPVKGVDDLPPEISTS